MAPPHANGACSPTKNRPGFADCRAALLRRDPAQGRGGPGDNWAVGWLQDPAGTNNTSPAASCRAMSFRRTTRPRLLSTRNALHRHMLPARDDQHGVGSATLRVSADSSQATFNFTYSGLSSTVTGEHIDNDPYLSNPSHILFDISATARNRMAATSGTSDPSGGLAPSDVIAILNEGWPTSPSSATTIPTANSAAISRKPTARIPSRHHLRRRPGRMTIATPVPRRASSSRRRSAPARRRCHRAVHRLCGLDQQPVQPAGDAPSRSHSDQPSTDPTLPYPGNTVFNAWWRQSVTGARPIAPARRLCPE